jgi:AAA domain
MSRSPSPEEARRAAREAGGQEDCVPELRVVPVSQIKVKATEWLWHHRIPLGALTLLPGREGTGKSTAGTWLAAQVTLGMLPGVYEGIPKGVFYAAREDDWERTIAPRIIAAGADISKVYRIEVTVSGSVIELTLPEHIDLLRDGIRKHDVALLFIDPLMSVISSKLDTHKDRETRLALEPLAAAAMDTDSAVVGLTHFSKSLTTDALNLVMASKAFTAVPRAVIGMARDDEAEEDHVVVLSQIKSNLGPLEVPSLKFTFQQVTVETEDGRGAHVGRLVELGESERSVDEILAGRGDEDDQETWNGAAWWLYDY